MPKLMFEGRTVDLRPGQSVLDALQSSGQPIAFGCRSGACQACLMVAETGELPSVSQLGLSSAQRAAGLFMSCQCRPEAGQELRIRRIDSASRLLAEVIDKHWLARDILRLRLQADVDFLPGQYLTLWRDPWLARSYSIANRPNPERIVEIHIKRWPNGAFSSWANEMLKIGDGLEIQGPMGHCVYAGQPDQPLLLVAMGTGLGPISAILREALSRGHRGAIHLYAAWRHAANAYLLDELTSLCDTAPQLKLRFMALEGQREGIDQGDLYAAIAHDLPELSGFQVYACGGMTGVRKLRRQCFMAGAAMQDIHADVFLPFASSGEASKKERVA